MSNFKKIQRLDNLWTTCLQNLNPEIISIKTLMINDQKSPTKLLHAFNNSQQKISNCTQFFLFSQNLHKRKSKKFQSKLPKYFYDKLWIFNDSAFKKSVKILIIIQKHQTKKKAKKFALKSQKGSQQWVSWKQQGFHDQLFVCRAILCVRIIDIYDNRVRIEEQKEWEGRRETRQTIAGDY